MAELEPTLILIPLLAVLAPLLARGLRPWVRVPIVVFEVLLGIIIGPSVLGWAQPTEFATILSNLGLAMLFFVAGTEIQFQGFRGRTGRNAIIGWLVSFVLAIGLAWIIRPGAEAIVIGVALCSTSLGTLVPVLRDAGELHTPFGRAVGVVGAVGEFGPLIAISIFLGGREPGAATIVLAGFAVVAGLAIWFAFKVPRGAMHSFVNATLHTSGQFAIRVVFLILAALTVLSMVLDLDMLLGAFTAGIVWRLLMRDAEKTAQEAVESKVEAVAFGFLIPIFFIYTGVTFDLESLIADPILFVFVPVVLVVLFVVRGIPSMRVAPKDSTRRDRLAVGFLGATALPIIVAVTAIGVDEGILSSASAAVLVGAGMLSVLLFPLIGMGIRGEHRVEAEEPVEDDVT